MDPDLEPINPSEKYSQYPPVLGTELGILDVVGQSAANFCGYLNELLRAVTADDKSSGQAALGILFGNPPLGISPGWTTEFEKVDHLIVGVASPVELKLPRHEDWLSICTYERPEWKTDEVEARLSIFERQLTKDIFSSAHHAATVLPGSLVNSLRIAGLGARDEDLGGNLSNDQWEQLKLCLSFLAKHDFAALRCKIEEESIAAKTYARETVVGKARLKNDAEVQEKTVKRTKPIGKTVNIIRLIQAGKKNDEIATQTGESVTNVRKIRSQLKSNKYEI